MSSVILLVEVMVMAATTLTVVGGGVAYTYGVCATCGTLVTHGATACTACVGPEVVEAVKRAGRELAYAAWVTKEAA